MISNKVKYNKLILVFVVLLLCFSVFSILSSQKTNAVSAGDWRPGRIIDDSVFFNKYSMSAAQIQDFLNAKVPNCDRWNPTTFRYAGKPYGPPYTCLKEYQENPTTHENNIGRFNPDGTPYNVTGGWSAAQIIMDASQSYGINPQSLIVLLQKETAIVTDSWAAGWQYDRAMGYGCPDSGPNGTANCNAGYYGFYNQVGNAAWQLRRYVTNANEYNFKAGVTRNILWQVGGVCGSSPVYIENSATAALYNYTPYQPNQAALNNLYGTGDGCSAYGNRNFWRIFNDWFGSGYIPPNYGSLNSAVNTSSWLEYGASKTITIGMKNDGTTTWCSDGNCGAGQSPTRLVSQNYAPLWLYDPSDSAWITPSQVKMQTPVVAPGQIGIFTFRVKAPYQTLSVSNRFFLNIEGKYFIENANVWIGANTYPTQISLLSNSGPWGVIYPNQKVKATVKIRNNSQTTLYADSAGIPNTKPFRLSTPGYQSSPFYDSTDPAWLTPSQIAMKTPVVAPGEDAVFEFNIKGSFNEYRQFVEFIPVIDGLSVLNNIGIRYYVDNPKPQLSYSYVSSVPPPQTMVKNTSSPSKVSITLKNTSNTVWRNETGKNPTRLVMIFPKYRISPFYDSTDPAWLTPSQIAMKTPVVAPGEDAVFEFNWKSPNSGGNYLEYFGLVTDGYQFFPEYGSAFRTIVN